MYDGQSVDVECVQQENEIETIQLKCEAIIVVWLRNLEIYKALTNKIQVFINRSLRRIFRIRWYDKMSNVELWKATDQELAEVLLKRRRWTWIGHTLRKPRDNIPRRALQWNPQGQRNRGRPKNTWRRGVEQEMKEAGVTWVHWKHQHRIARSGKSSLVAYAPHLERQRLQSSKSSTKGFLHHLYPISTEGCLWKTWPFLSTHWTNGTE